MRLGNGVGGNLGETYWQQDKYRSEESGVSSTDK